MYVDKDMKKSKINIVTNTFPTTKKHINLITYLNGGKNESCYSKKL